MQKLPDTFIVGAPKCGTTALARYLGEHPEIYVPAAKELHYFARDLDYRVPRPDLPEYLGYFKKGGASTRWLDATVWYLFSRTAAQEIMRFNADARIIIMLRNPVDMIYSLHSQLLYTGMEDIEDFEQALEAEADRRDGRRLPEGAWFPETVWYRAQGRYADGVERYLNTFPAGQVQVILFDDFKNYTNQVYQQTLEFLGVDSSFRTNLSVVNPNTVARSRMLRKLSGHPWVVGMARKFISGDVRAFLIGLLARTNSKAVQRQELQHELRRQLSIEFSADIARLEALLNRDLSHWRVETAEEVQVANTRLTA